MESIKFRVKSPEHSKAIQESMFAHGYSWSDGKVIDYTDEPFLYGYSSGVMSYGTIESYFRCSDAVEMFTPLPATTSSAEGDAGSTQVLTNPKKLYGDKSLPLNLWPPIASAYGSLGLLNGSLKYSSSNFVASPVDLSIYLSAIQRHLASFTSGEECDPVDGVPHLSACLANIAIILEARAAGTLIDDRSISEGYLKERDKLKEVVAHLQELHKDKNPIHHTRNNVHVKRT